MFEERINEIIIQRNSIIVERDNGSEALRVRDLEM